MNRYLNSNPTNWLSEENDYCVCYLTQRDILDIEPDYARLEQADSIKKILDIGQGDIPGNKRRHDTFHSGTVWFFAETVTRGLDTRSPSVSKSAQFICDNLQTPSGGFSFDWNPRIATGCRTGEMVRYMLTAGINNKNISNGVEWILKHQRHDGGWLHCPLANFCDTMKLMLLKKPGNGLRRENNPKTRSCPVASISCALALTLVKQKDERHFTAVKNAADFFLNNNLFLEEENYKKPGYPVLRQYDITMGLLFISRAGFFNDSRTAHAFNHLMSLQKDNGRWRYLNFSPGMLFKAGKNTENIDKWTTLNILRILKEGEKSVHEGIAR